MFKVKSNKNSLGCIETNKKTKKKFVLLDSEQNIMETSWQIGIVMLKNTKFKKQSTNSYSFSLKYLKLAFLIVFLSFFIPEVSIIDIIIGLLFLILWFFSVLFHFFIILLAIKISCKGWVLAEWDCLKLSVRKKQGDRAK